MAAPFESQETHDRETIRKLFLSIVPQMLEIEDQSSNTSIDASLDEQNARKRRYERQQCRRRLSLSSKMRTMFIPYTLTNGMSLTTNNEPSVERRLWTRERSSMWWDVVVKEHWTDQDWIENFRMTKSTFMYICEKVRDKITYHNTNMRRALPVEQRMAITIWRLATNCGYRVIGDLFGVGVSTVCTIIQQTCKAFASSMQQEFMVLPAKDKLQAIVDGFMNEHGFPQVAGCIATCHIPIKRPDSNNSQDYINAEGNPTIILQGIVDHKGQFSDVSAGWQGSTSEEQILRQSPLYQPIRDGALFPDSSIEIEGESIPALLLGGSGYPLLRNVMKPFPGQDGTLNDFQQLFNEKLGGVLKVAEAAFQRLKGRWQILQKRNEHKIAFIPDIITTCCILHNICERHGEPLSQDIEEPQPSHPPIHPTQDDDASAEQTRDALASYFFKRLANVQFL
ncbi:protein ANTAGONIST OF LIKE HETEROCHROMATIN PROTEIN 1-like [Patiria miniata]|uniref:DDE Tnp4 domain-containing protein n=1 Tax=Patiria miniata TaxID=46514 RepID=A0A913ZZ36_PATMI|nr:protein ANTAGONIST OF LIKE HETEROCHROMATIN PROTEIN 1-like [Patiria miniata]